MKPYVVGIDLGGTNTVFGIVDARGVVIASSSIKTCKHNTVDGFIEDLYVELTRLIKANDAEGKIHGIGIGAPVASAASLLCAVIFYVSGAWKKEVINGKFF